jgi:hypothetical protein
MTARASQLLMGAARYAQTEEGKGTRTFPSFFVFFGLCAPVYPRAQGE